MKILKPGIIPKPKKIIYKTTCSYCGCVFEFESDDFMFNVRQINNKEIIINCPFCNERIEIDFLNVEYREEEVNE